MMALKVSFKVIMVVAVAFLGIPGVIATQTSLRPSAGNSPSSQQAMTVNSYTGSVEIKRNTETEYMLFFDLTCNFHLGQKVSPDYWNVSYSLLKASYAELDGRLVNIDSKSGNFRLDLKQEVGVGNHKLKIKYGCTMNVFSPDRAKMQIFAGSNHFHLTGNWFPVPTGSYQFNSKVRFDIQLEIPKDWIAAGWGQMKNDGKPDKNGHLKFVVDETDPKNFRIVGGKYNLKNIPIKKAVLKIFTFAGSKMDIGWYGKNAENISTFYEDYFGFPANGQFFIMETTGQIGASYNVSGGYAAEKALLEDGLKMGDFATMISRMSWFGESGVTGSDNQPDKMIFDRSFPSFASLLYCRSICPTQFICDEWEKMLNMYLTSKNPDDSAIVDPNSANCDAVIEYKTPLALYALRNYMGDEKFKTGMREFFKKHAWNAKTRSRIKAGLADFRQIMEKVFGHPLDDFWELHFKSNMMLNISYGIERVFDQTKVYVDRLFIKSDVKPPYPLKFRLFYSDGQFEDVVFDETVLEKNLDKPAGGVDFVDYYTIIPSPDLPMNTMCTSTIEAVCAWKKPVIYCVSEDGQECVDRARLLEKRFKSDLLTQLPDVLPTKPVIVTGKSAQTYIATHAMEKLSIKWDDGSVFWGESKLKGLYDALMLVFDPANPNTPIIFDSGGINIPEKCDRAAFFRARDGMLDFAVDYLNPSQGEFPNDQLLDLPWEQSRSAISGSMYTLPAINLDGTTLSYPGFDTEAFLKGQMTKKLVPGEETPLLLDMTGGKAKLTLDRADRFVTQTWRQELVCGMESQLDEKTLELSYPKAVTGDSLQVSWKGEMQYLANIDGKTAGSWSRSDRAAFGNLAKGWHTIKLAFIDKENILSDIFTIKTMTGAVLPKLVLDKPKALFRDGKVIISGKTDPGCSLVPLTTVNPDGSFKINMPVKNPPVNLTVKSTNEFGLSSSLTIPVVRYRRIEMWLGQTKTVDQDGVATELSVPPQIVSGTTCIPMRFIGESLGATVSWIEDERKVVYMLDDVTVELWIGRTQATVNGNMLNLPVPPTVVNGKTMVPARFICEALGANVTWEALDKKITIEYPALLL
jgi:hypothetical protein